MLNFSRLERCLEQVNNPPLPYVESAKTRRFVASEQWVVEKIGSKTEDRRNGDKLEGQGNLGRQHSTEAVKKPSNPEGQYAESGGVVGNGTYS